MASTLALQSRGGAHRSDERSLARNAPSGRPLVLACFESSLTTTTIDRLEAIASKVEAGWVDRHYARIPGSEAVGVLATCHRLEVYAVASTSAALEGWRSALPGRGSDWVERRGFDAVRHLYRVAAGLESLAVGEAEVRQQVRRARHSVASRYPRSLLAELFERAATDAPPSPDAGEAPDSVARRAVERLLRTIGSTRPRILVVGAGHVGRQVVEQLRGRADITWVYHRRPPDPELVAAAAATAVASSGWTERLRTVDAVVTAAKAGARSLRPGDLPEGHPLLLIDLGMPRNIDPTVRSVPGVRLVDLGDLRAAELDVLRATGRPASRELERRARTCWADLDRRFHEPWIGAFRRSAEATRRQELRLALAHLGELDAGQLVALDKMSRRLVGRLLDPATERIRAIPAGAEGERIRRWSVALLQPDRSRS